MLSACFDAGTGYLSSIDKLNVSDGDLGADDSGCDVQLALVIWKG